MITGTRVYTTDGADESHSRFLSVSVYTRVYIRSVSSPQRSIGLVDTRQPADRDRVAISSPAYEPEVHSYSESDHRLGHVSK